MIDEDRAGPDVRRWTLDPPAAGTTSPVTLHFREALDQALLARSLSVRDPGGHVMPGRVEIADEERTWRFQPDSEWPAGEYTIHVDPALEDLAGNSLARVFDLDLHDPLPREETGPIALRFVVQKLTAAANSKTPGRDAGRY